MKLGTGRVRIGPLDVSPPETAASKARNEFSMRDGGSSHTWRVNSDGAGGCPGTGVATPAEPGGSMGDCDVDDAAGRMPTCTTGMVGDVPGMPGVPGGAGVPGDPGVPGGGGKRGVATCVRTGAQGPLPIRRGTVGGGGGGGTGRTTGISGGSDGMLSRSDGIGICGSGPPPLLPPPDESGIRGIGNGSTRCAEADGTNAARSAPTNAPSVMATTSCFTIRLMLRPR
ncbi:MAG: hypothetical protein HYR51_07830 [Candidatus Rokubacteria bacterium]|nr:hypothetical protein [Candidatus Rokubacteria bacterium]